MTKDWAVGAFTIPVKVLRDDGRNGHGDANKAVVVDSDPVNVEPCKTALGSPPGTSLLAAARREPVDGPYPGLNGAHLTKKCLLRVQIRCYIVTEEGKKGSNSECFVAVRNDLEVNGVPVPFNLEKRGNGVYGNHEEDANDAATG